MKSIKDKLYDLVHSFNNIQIEANNLLCGKRVKILSKYNGQPYGRSKKPLTGTIHTIQSVYIDHNGLGIFIDNWRLSLGLKEVEIL